MRLLCLLIAALSTTTLFAQTEPETRSTYDLRGEVKKLEEVVYDAREKFGEPVKEKKDRKWEYRFNKDGYNTARILQQYEAKSKFAVINRYDNENKVIEFTEEDDDAFVQGKIKYYDNGDMKEIDLLDKKGKLTGRHKFETEHYNDTTGDLQFSNKHVTQTIYDAEGDFAGRIKIDYLLNGILTTERHYDPKNNEVYTENRSLDKITNYRRINGRDTSSCSFTYNNKMQLTGKTYTRGRSKPDTYNYEYNSNGDLKKETNSYGTVTEYSYTYDVQKNWITMIKKETSSGGEVKYEITERTITYY